MAKMMFCFSSKGRKTLKLWLVLFAQTKSHTTEKYGSSANKVQSIFNCVCVCCTYRLRCLTSGWKATCLWVPSVPCVIRHVAAYWDCRTGAASGAKLWWDICHIWIKCKCCSCPCKMILACKRDWKDTKSWWLNCKEHRHNTDLIHLKMTELFFLIVCSV